MIVQDVMSRDVVSINPDKDILDVLYTLYKTKVDVLPVVDGELFIGVVTMRNLMSVLPYLEYTKPEDVLVTEIINKNQKSVKPNDDVQNVIEDLCQRGCYGVPVLSGHNLAGMVGRREFVKIFSEQLARAYKVGDLMYHNVSVNNIYDPIESVGKKILQGKDRRLVIVDREEVKGVITLSDLSVVLFSESRNLYDLSIEQVMSPSPLTVSRGADAADAARMMVKYSVGGILVQDKNHQPEGWIRDRDIIHGLQIRL